MHVQMRVPWDWKGRRMPAADDRSGPTALKMMLGIHLRRLREQCQMSREQAATVIGGSGSKISRLELGRLTSKTADVAALLTCYGVTSGPERDELLKMARYANARGWWQDYSGVLPVWFQNYVGLESAASQVRTYETQFIPGLLQTGAYMRAVMCTGRTPTTAQRVASRRQRQKILTRPDTSFWAVIDEGALRRPIGGREVMHQQLEYLLHVIEQRSTVAIQVLPFAIGSHAGEAGAFSYLRFGEPDLPEIVYLEQLTRASYVDTCDEVEQYRRAFEHLTMTAQTPAESAETIAKIMAAL
jgi:hypothetical protein